MNVEVWELADCLRDRIGGLSPPFSAPSYSRAWPRRIRAIPYFSDAELPTFVRLSDQEKHRPSVPPRIHEETAGGGEGRSIEAVGCWVSGDDKHRVGYHVFISPFSHSARLGHLSHSVPVLVHDDSSPVAPRHTVSVVHAAQPLGAPSTTRKLD